MDTDATATPATPATPATTTPAVDAKPAPEIKIADKFAAIKTRAKEATAPKPAADAKPAVVADAKPAAVDPDVAAVERILKEDARVKADAKRVAAEKTAWEAEKAKGAKELQQAQAAAAARAKGDVLGTLHALGFTNADIYEGETSILFKLAEARSASPQVDEKARLEAVVAEKLAEKDAATKSEKEAAEKAEKDRVDKENAEAQATIDASQEEYSKVVSDVVLANPDKYRALIKHKVPAGVVTRYAWQTLINTKGATQLLASEALDDLEKHYQGLAKEIAAPETKEEPAAKPHRGISVNPDSQARTPAASAFGGGGSLNDKWAQLKARARTATPATRR